jgi:large subunit ribosomal protein L5
MNTLKNHYKTYVIPKLMEEFKYQNIHQIPKIEKIQVSAGLGLNGQNRVFLQKSIDEIKQITGQHPILTKAKKSVAGFKVREDMPLGLTTTLRNEKMYAFLEKMIKLVLPRIRDFRGLKTTSFDQHGNYNFGISDQLVFPEIQFDNVEQRRGFNITVVTTATTKTEALFLLDQIGIPFTQTSKKD